MTDLYPEHSATSDLHESGSSQARVDFIGSIADAARSNPVSAALIGLGALWLFTGGGRMSLVGGRGRTSVISAAAHGAGTLASEAAHSAGRAGSAVSLGLSSAASGLADTMSTAGEYVRETIHGVDAEAEYRNEGLAHGGSEKSLRRSRSGTAPGAVLLNNMSDLFENHPWALGLAGLALGMGMAASLPMTKRERDTLGKARDATGEKVDEVVEQAKEFGGAVMSEIERRGFSSGP